MAKTQKITFGANGRPVRNEAYKSYCEEWYQTRRKIVEYGKSLEKELYAKYGVDEADKIALTDELLKYYSDYFLDHGL